MADPVDPVQPPVDDASWRTTEPAGEGPTGTHWSRGEPDGTAHVLSNRRYRRGAILIAIATLAAAAGVPVLFHPSLDGSPPEHDMDPPPSLLLAETSPSAVPESAPSTAPTGAAFPSTGAPPATTAAPAVTIPAGPTDQPLTKSPRPDPGPPSPGPDSLEAEGPGAVRSGSASPRPLAGASAGMVVSSIGNGSANLVRFPAVQVATTGSYTVTLYYASPERRKATITVNGHPTSVRFPATGDAVGRLTIRVYLTSGGNVIEYGNPHDWAPELDRIAITA